MAFWAPWMTHAAWIIVPPAISRLFGWLGGGEPRRRYELGTLDVPTIEAGTPIPVVFGTAWVTPQLLWWGDVRVAPITEEWLTGLVVRTSIYGYRYYAGVQWGICHSSIDRIVAIRVDDVTIWDTGSTANESIVIDAEDAFGGERESGGVSGTVDLEFGGAAQAQNAYLLVHQPTVTSGADIPAYRGIVSAVLNQCYLCANTPEWKPWQFQIRSQGGAAVGTHDINPVKIIELALTNEEWGLGLDATDLDTTAFTAATATLLSEGLGMSFVWNTTSSVQELLEKVCTHIMAVLYVDRTTGKVTIRLIREDYVTADLPELDETNISAIEAYSRPTLAEMGNTVTARYTDRDGNETSFTTHNIALIAAMSGQTIEQEVTYDLVRDADVIEELTARDLRYLSTPLSTLAIIGTRELRTLDIGDPFVLSWDEYGIVSEVFRVAWIDYGTLTDGQIRIHAMQDLYAAAGAIYAAQPGTYWETPVNDPAAAPERLLLEAPYRLLLNWFGPAGPSTFGFDADAGWLLTGVQRPSEDALDYDLYTLDGATYVIQGRYSFTPRAELTAAIGQAVTTTVTVDDDSDLDQVEVGNWCVIDEEICEVVAVNATTGSVTLARGILDTVPEAHAIDATVWFMRWFGSDGTVYASADTATAKAVTRTMTGSLAIGDAPADNLVMDDRFIRPYPPGNLQMNAEAYPAFIVGELVVTWAHRNRLTQIGDYVTQDEIGIATEAGVTYRFYIYDETDTLAVSEAALTVETYTYDLTTEIADLGIDRPNETMRVELWSVRAGYASWQKHDFTILECRGYGMFYGAYYGE